MEHLSIIRIRLDNQNKKSPIALVKKIIIANIKKCNSSSLSKDHSKKLVFIETSCLINNMVLK